MSEYFDPAKYEGWVCADCKIPLQLSKVDVLPLFSPASIIATPMRSLTLFSGWKNSHLAKWLKLKRR